jgi:hypothetical protein
MLPNPFRLHDFPEPEDEDEEDEEGTPGEESFLAKIPLLVAIQGAGLPMS